MNRPAWDAARIRARPHGGYIRRATFLRCGVKPSAIDSALTAGRLLKVLPGVYCFPPEPLEPRLRAWAPLLACGEGAALHGETARAMYDLRRSWPTPTHVISPRRCAASGFRLLHAKWLTPEDIRVVQGLPVLSPALTVLYTAHRFPTDPKLIRAINTLRLGHGMTSDDLAAALARFPRHPNARLLRVTVPTLTTNPTRSGNEDRWPAFAHRYDLPPYEMNVNVADHLVDVYIPNPGLIVEIDGAQHDIQVRTDAARDTHIFRVTGIPTLRIPDTDFRSRPEQTAARIHAEVDRLRRLAS